MTPTGQSGETAPAPDFDALVARHYASLYRFAYSLTRAEADAADLTQQTFYIWAKKGAQLRDAAKVKTWLFTTLHREFLKARRRESRHPHEELGELDYELPAQAASVMDTMDTAAVIQALGRVDDVFQAPLALFYLEEHSYKEIAEILEVPIGTVQSRVARGKAQLQRLLFGAAGGDVKERYE